MRIFSLLVLLALAAPLFGGCGDKPVIRSGNDAGLDNDAGAGGDVGVDGFSGEINPSLEEAHEKLRLAECGKIFNCCSADQRSETFGLDPADSEEACQTNRGLIPIEVELAMISEAVEMGRLEFDASMVDLCLESYQNQACETWTEAEPTTTRLTGCPEVITPLVEEGDTCKFDYECISGYCALGDDGLGNCAVPAAKGEACDSKRCNETTYCDIFEVECAAKRVNGSSCVEDQDCLSGECAASGTGELTCREPAPLCAQDDNS